MGKNKKKNKANRKIKAQKFHNNLQQIKADSLEKKKRSKYKIPGTVAISTIEDELLEIINNKTFSLVFEHYNNNICGIPKISSQSEAKNIISIFQSISKSTPQNIQNTIRNTIKKEEAEKDYKKLFRGLPDDIDLVHEAHFSRSGRMFFFTISGEHNFACVVSVNPHHF